MLYCQAGVKYLGYIISREGMKTNPGVSIVVNYPVPKTVLEVRFLPYLTGFHRMVLPNYAKRAKSLTQLK
jgi:hypothetical protein